MRAWLRRSLDPDDLEDISQETYAKIDGIDDIGHTRNGRAYSFTAARSAVLMQLRHACVVSIETVMEIDSLGIVSDEPSTERIVIGRRELARVTRGVVDTKSGSERPPRDRLSWSRRMDPKPKPNLCKDAPCCPKADRPKVRFGSELRIPERPIADSTLLTFAICSSGWGRRTADSEDPTEEEIDAVITEFDGDMRTAIRALMHDLSVLANDLSSVVSRGYVRGRVQSATMLPFNRRTGPRG